MRSVVNVLVCIVRSNATHTCVHTDTVVLVHGISITYDLAFFSSISSTIHPSLAKVNVGS